MGNYIGQALIAFYYRSPDGSRYEGVQCNCVGASLWSGPVAELRDMAEFVAENARCFGRSLARAIRDGELD